MSHTPHDLADEFPAHVEKIHELKSTNQHFARLCETHHHINREIHRGETNVEPMDDVHLEDLKKQRLSLLDEISTFFE